MTLLRSVNSKTNTFKQACSQTTVYSTKIQPFCINSDKPKELFWLKPCGNHLQRELLALISGPGFDVKIGTVHISVNMKLFQDKCVAVIVIVRKIPKPKPLHTLQLVLFLFFLPRHQQKRRKLACSIYYLIRSCFIYKKTNVCFNISFSIKLRTAFYGEIFQCLCLLFSPAWIKLAEGPVLGRTSATAGTNTRFKSKTPLLQQIL